MNAPEVNKIVDFWIQSSDQDYKTMTDLFITKNLHWSLFMGHLVIEKLLKEFTTEWITKIDKTREWIKNLL